MKPNIPEGKKRVVVTLTAETVKEFHRIAKEIGMNKNFMSRYFDEQLFYGIKMMKEIKKTKEGQEIDFPAIFEKVLRETY